MQKKTTIYDIPTYRTLLRLSQKEEELTPEEKQVLEGALPDLYDDNLADELFDLIRRTPNSTTRHAILNAMHRKTAEKTAVTTQIDRKKTTAQLPRMAATFTAIITMQPQPHKKGHHQATYAQKMTPEEAISIARMIHETAGLSDEATILISPQFHTTDMLSRMTANRLRKDIALTIEKDPHKPAGTLPLTHPGNSPDNTTDAPSATNTAMVGALIYTQPDDFDKLFIMMPSSPQWAKKLKSTIRKSISKDGHKPQIDIFPFLYPPRASINEMANIQRTTELSTATKNNATTTVFYTYSQWKQKNAHQLLGKDSEYHRAQYTEFITRWHNDITRKIAAGKQPAILLGDVTIMTEYIRIKRLNPDSKKSWREAQRVIELIEDPVIEVLEEHHTPGHGHQPAVATISPHTNQNQIVIYAVISVNDDNGKRLARYILWNTHTHTASQSKQKVMKLLHQWHVTNLYHYKPEPVRICPCCNEILAAEYEGHDASGNHPQVK